MLATAQFNPRLAKRYATYSIKTTAPNRRSLLYSIPLSSSYDLITIHSTKIILTEINTILQLVQAANQCLIMSRINQVILSDNIKIVNSHQVGIIELDQYLLGQNNTVQSS